MLKLSADPVGSPSKKHVYKACSGSNLSPYVSWSTPPKGTKSLALVLHDSDAPVPGGWIHWIIYNIPPTVLEIKGQKAGEEIKIPDGAVVAKNSFGEIGYGGPCPPPGKLHHYNLHLFALPSLLPKSDAYDQQPNSLFQTIQNAAIATSKVTSTYQR